MKSSWRYRTSPGKRTAQTCWLGSYFWRSECWSIHQDLCWHKQLLLDRPFLPFNLLFFVFVFLALREFLAVHLYKVPFYPTFKTVVIHRWYRFCYTDRSFSDWCIRHVFPFDSWLAIFFFFLYMLNCFLALTNIFNITVLPHDRQRRPWQIPTSGRNYVCFYSIINRSTYVCQETPLHSQCTSIKWKAYDVRFFDVILTNWIIVF